MLLSVLMGGAAPVLFPLARPADAVPVLVVGWFFRALASPFYGVNQVSLRLAITPPALLARMTATMKVFVMGAMPLGSFLGGALAGSLGSRSTLWLIAGVPALSVLAVAGTKLREVPVPPEELRPEVAWFAWARPWPGPERNRQPKTHGARPGRRGPEDR